MRFCFFCHVTIITLTEKHTVWLPIYCLYAYKAWVTGLARIHIGKIVMLNIEMSFRWVYQHRRVVKRLKKS